MYSLVLHYKYSDILHSKENLSPSPYLLVRLKYPALRFRNGADLQCLQHSSHCVACRVYVRYVTDAV